MTKKNDTPVEPQTEERNREYPEADSCKVRWHSRTREIETARKPSKTGTYPLAVGSRPSAVGAGLPTADCRLPTDDVRTVMRQPFDTGHDGRTGTVFRFASPG